VNRHVVLIAIGEDRPGLVEEVSEFVFTRGGTIHESRMANLGGQFAIAMLIAGTGEAIAEITSAVDQLSSQTGLHLQLTPASGPNAAAAAAEGSPYRLTGRALDQPGLVHLIADVLHSFHVNVESMETTLEAAPHTATPIFKMDLMLSVPQNASVPDLRTALAQACNSLNIDFELVELDRARLPYR